MKHKSKLYDISKDDLQALCDSSVSLQDVLRKLDSQSLSTLKKVIEEKQIDLTKLKNSKNPKENLTGRTFGDLTVLDIDYEKSTKAKIYWNCLCKCGNTISVSGGHLKRGTSSCGCKQKETTRKLFKKYNIYDLSKEYGVGYTTNTNKEFYFDLKDYDKIKKFAWRESTLGYLISYDKDKIIVYFHRLIMNPDKDCEVDHINHNKLDNRKDNLRVCSRLQNSHNRGDIVTNTSGFRGVQWEKRFNRWRSRIKVNGKDIHLGLFEDYDEAVNARKEAEIKYYGEFRYQGKD